MNGVDSKWTHLLVFQFAENSMLIFKSYKIIESVIFLGKNNLELFL